MAGFNYTTNLAAVVQALKDYNTTTAAIDLSAGLTTRIPDDNIMAGDPSVSMIRNDRIPAVFVRINSADENFLSIGPTGPTKNTKEKNVVYDIFAMYAREGVNATFADTLNEIGNMVRNIEAVFQAEFQLSATALWCQARRTSIANVPLDSQGATWIKTAMIELEAKYYFR